MQISLKQSEIVAAIYGYIETQGINLFGKNVDITFTSGRKGNGLSADVDIYTGEKVVEVVEATETDAPESVDAEPIAVEAEAAPVVETGSLFG